MPSFLDEIVDFTQIQQEYATQNSLSPLPPPTPLGGLDPQANNGESLPSGPEGEDEDEGVQPPFSTHEPPNVTAFTVSTARNLQLTTDGEKSLLRFSQVIYPPFYLAVFTPLTHVKLDTKSALIYQQAMLIKLNETYLRCEPSTNAQGLYTGNRLVLTNEIKVTHKFFPDKTLTPRTRVLLTTASDSL